MHPHISRTELDRLKIQSESNVTEHARQRDDCGRIIRLPTIRQLTGLSTSTIYAMMARGDFPRPVRLGKRAVGWPEHVVREWLDSREQAVS
jgi:prophage regulatory protein